MSGTTARSHLENKKHVFFFQLLTRAGQIRRKNVQRGCASVLIVLCAFQWSGKIFNLHNIRARSHFVFNFVNNFTKIAFHCTWLIIALIQSKRDIFIEQNTVFVISWRTIIIYYNLSNIFCMYTYTCIFIHPTMYTSSFR